MANFKNRESAPVFKKPFLMVPWGEQKTSTQYSSCRGGLAWIKDFECAGDPTSNHTN